MFSLSINFIVEFLQIERLGTDSIEMRKRELLHSMKVIYYPVITFTHYEWEDTLATILLQAIPAFLMDFFNPEKIRLLAVSRKIKSMKNVITFFMNKRIFFDNSNVVKIYDRYETMKHIFALISDSTQAHELQYFAILCCVIWQFFSLFFFQPNQHMFSFYFPEWLTLIKSYFQPIHVTSIGISSFIHILLVCVFMYWWIQLKHTRNRKGSFEN